jgi:hypothetical protein
MLTSWKAAFGWPVCCTVTVAPLWTTEMVSLELVPVTVSTPAWRTLDKNRRDSRF